MHVSLSKWAALVYKTRSKRSSPLSCPGAYQQGFRSGISFLRDSLMDACKRVNAYSGTAINIGAFLSLTDSADITDLIPFEYCQQSWWSGRCVDAMCDSWASQADARLRCLRLSHLENRGDPLLPLQTEASRQLLPLFNTHWLVFSRFRLGIKQSPAGEDFMISRIL